MPNDWQQVFLPVEEENSLRFSPFSSSSSSSSRDNECKVFLLSLSLTSAFTQRPALRAKLLSASCISQYSCHTSRELASMRFVRAIVNSLGFISFVPSFNSNAKIQRKQINILNEGDFAGLARHTVLFSSGRVKCSMLKVSHRLLMKKRR